MSIDLIQIKFFIFASSVKNGENYLFKAKQNSEANGLESIGLTAATIITVIILITLMLLSETEGSENDSTQ